MVVKINPRSLKFIKNVLVPRIKKGLTPDLLKKNYVASEGGNSLAGHCYVASESLWYMLSEHQRTVLKPHYLKVGDQTHWFLKSKDGVVVDPTAKQFRFALDYTKAKGCGFLTKTPSIRSQVLLKRLTYENQNDVKLFSNGGADQQPATAH